MKRLYPHPATVVLPDELPRHNRRRKLRGLVLGGAHFLVLSTGYNRPDDEAVGGTIYHRAPDGWCQGAIMFEPNYGPPVWSVESWDPLSCSPSFACHCGTCHGFIKEGRWSSAGCSHPPA